MNTHLLAAGTVSSDRTDKFVGQIIDRLTDDVLTVWHLDLKRPFRARDSKSQPWEIGDIVFCVWDTDRKFVAELLPVGSETEEIYRNKRFLRD